MFRLTKTSETVYALEIEDDFRDVDEKELENIHHFASTGTPVVICDDLEDAAELYGIEVDEIEIVEPD